MKVRSAVPEDMDWIIFQLRIFADRFGSKTSLIGDEDHWREGILGIIQQHLFLVAEDRNKTRAGFIAAIASPHMFNPKIRVLTEVFWWVSEPFRRGRAGYMLLKEYISWGKKNSDWISISSIPSSEINEGSLLRLGFRLQERNYLLEA